MNSSKPTGGGGPLRSDLTAQEALYRIRWPLAAGAVALLVLAIVLAGFAAGRPAPSTALDPAAAEQAAERPPAVTQDAVVNGQPARLVVPASGQITAVAILFPAEGRGADAVDDAWLRPLIDSGWAIATSDFHGDGWGSPQTSGDARALVNWAQITAQAPVTMFIAQSMGALDSLQSLWLGRVAMPCWYGVEPIADLRVAAEDPGIAQSILTAWDGVAPTWTDSPINHLDRFPLAAQYRVIAATEDVPAPWRGADDLVERLQESGRTVTVQALPVAHGDPSLTDGADLLAFAGGCA